MPKANEEKPLRQSNVFGDLERQGTQSMLQSNISFNHQRGKINKVLRQSLVQVERPALNMNVINKSFHKNEADKDVSQKAAFLMSQEKPPRVEESPASEFSQTNKLLLEISNNLKQNFKDRDILGKVDKNLLELIQANIRGIMETQLQAKQNDEMKTQFSSQQKLLDLQKRVLSLKKEIIGLKLFGYESLDIYKREIERLRGATPRVRVVVQEGDFDTQKFLQVKDSLSR